MSPRQSTEMRVPSWSVALTIAVSFSAWACSSAATQAPTSSPTQSALETPTSEPASTLTPTATPAPTAAGGVTQARDLLTEDEVAGFLGQKIARANLGGFSYGGVFISDGWDFSGEQGAFLTVALVTNGKEQFEQVRAQWPSPADVVGLGDEAFTTHDGAFIMAALKGTSAVYLYTDNKGSDLTESMRTLMTTALSRL